jgi:hypothetical protein
VISTCSIMEGISKNRFAIPLLAFFVPLCIRTIPEVLMGQYAVGFDTLAFYVPNTLTWLHNGINLFDYLTVAPLFYSIYLPLIAAGGSPILILKIISPLLLGLLGLVVYEFAKKGLHWSPSKSLVSALLSTLYFVALRISWDMLRNELALIFFFIALTLLSMQLASKKQFVLLSLVMLAAVLSDQLVAVLMLGIVIFTILANLLKKDYKKASSLLLASLPSALLLIIYLISVSQLVFLTSSTEVASLLSWTGFSSYESMLLNEVGFFLYCFLLLLPLAFISLKRFRNIQIISWLLVSLILLLLPTFVSPFRWILMLLYPLAFYTTETLSRLKRTKLKRFRVNLYGFAVLYLVAMMLIFSGGYIFAQPQQPFVYFNTQHVNNYIYQIPSSMLQNTIPLTDCTDTVNALQWFKDNVNSSGLLLTHTVFYGWALLSLNDTQIRHYGFDNPSNAAVIAQQEGYTQSYVIWWTNGDGWYAQPTVPPSFQEIYHSGRIAIYSYTLSK